MPASSLLELSNGRTRVVPQNRKRCVCVGDFQSKRFVWVAAVWLVVWGRPIGKCADMMV